MIKLINATPVLNAAPVNVSRHVNDRSWKIIAKGQSNKEIAKTLGVAPETIKTHVKRIFVKLSADRGREPLSAHRVSGLLRSLAID